MNKKSTFELLEFIHKSISIIKRRCKDIDTADEYLSSDENLDKFEASVMRIQTIGEALKNLNKRDENFLQKVAQKDYWSEIIKMRDLVSHHYLDIQADIIFDICKNELNELDKNIEKLKELL